MDEDDGFNHYFRDYNEVETDTWNKYFRDYDDEESAENV